MTDKDIMIMNIEAKLSLMFTRKGSLTFRMSLPKLNMEELRGLWNMLNNN